MPDPQQRVPAVPDQPKPPIRRDQRGWNVEPAPDGRGAPPAAPRPRMSWRIGLAVLALLIVNYASVALFAPSTNPRVRVPYSPFFLDQVQTNNVRDIAAQGTGIQGDFVKGLHYPRPNSTATTRFSTEVPAFADTNALSQLLQQHNVVINASPPSTGPSLLVNLLLGFGPALLIIGLLVVFARRAGGGA
ncbi:MAG: cell division protein FtsH, partial [Solirubrobacterales bacterium]